MGCCGGKDSSTSVVALQATDTVLAGLRGMVHEVHTHPGRVNQLVEKVLGPDLLPPTYKWLAGTPEVHAARVVCINSAIDAILSPAIERMHMAIRGSGGTGSKSWEDVTLSDLTPIIKEALHCQGELAPAALHKLLSKTCSLWEHTLMGSSHQTACPNRSVGELGAMLQLIISRRVLVESQERFRRLLCDWEDMVRLMVGDPTIEPEGLRRVLMPSCSPELKGALLYMSCIAARGETKFGFVTSRESPLEDGLRAAEQQQLLDATGCCGLKFFPRFSSQSTGTEQGEGHGPRKEYFTLVGKQIMALSSGTQSGTWPALFVYNRAAGALWVNQDIAESRANRIRYKFVGWLLAQAICNRTCIDARFPEVLFSKLIEGVRFEPSLETLRQFDPDVASGLDKLKHLSPQELSGLFELDGFAPNTTVGEYVSQQVHQILVSSVEWQTESLLLGWNLGIDVVEIAQHAITASDLQTIVCGVAAHQLTASLRDVFRVVMDPELSECSALVEALWSVFDGFDAAQKSQLMLFITGSARPPLPNTEILRIEMPFCAYGQKQQQNILQMLPQAHSCENLLELPNYHDALESSTGCVPSRKQLEQIIQAKFLIAIEHGQGYALDDVNASTSMELPGAMPSRASPSPSIDWFASRASPEPSRVTPIGQVKPVPSIDMLNTNSFPSAQDHQQAHSNKNPQSIAQEILLDDLLDEIEDLS